MDPFNLYRVGQKIELVRLQKYIADCGLTSRRKAEVMISEGLVSVNGVIVALQGIKVNPVVDEIAVSGKLLKYNPDADKITLLLHKPVGYVTTMDDPQKRPLVKDLYSNFKERLFPVGRLDINTSGLLLCTNDGTLANQLMHPRYKFEKEYRITVAGDFSKNDLALLSKGVELEDGFAKPLKVKIERSNQHQTIVLMVIAEGRNRQVRRMIQALGFQVTALTRIRLAFLTLDGVKKGAWRRLQEEELKRLQGLVTKE